MADDTKVIRAMSGRASRAYLDSLRKTAMQHGGMSSNNADRMPSPNPGTDAALRAGCICPVLDNEHGRGYMGQPNVFVYTAGCPIHSNRGADGW